MKSGDARDENYACTGGGDSARNSACYAGNYRGDIHYTAPGAAEHLLEQYTYDNIGRIKTRALATQGQTSYDWDDRGYLIQVTRPGTVITYTYDALGQRKTKTVNGVTTRYVTAPIFGMSHVLMELDGNNGIQRTYLYGGNQQLGEEPVATNRAADRYLLQGGSVGNITHAVNRAGVIENEYGYDAFGMRTNVTTTGASTRHGYTGEHYDEETGLLYLRARYYDPMIGRFISVDPYLGRLEEPGTQNRYAYVGNNPLLYVDPSGLDSVNFNVGIGLGPGVNFGVSIDTSNGDVYTSGGIGVGIGVSGTATYSTATPSKSYSWNFEGAGGLPGPIPAGGSVSTSWDATAYSNSGQHQSSAAKNVGLGYGAGFSATGTFQGSWRIGNLGDSLNWWKDLFGFPSSNSSTNSCSR